MSGHDLKGLHGDNLLEALLEPLELLLCFVDSHEANPELLPRLVVLDLLVALAFEGRVRDLVGGAIWDQGLDHFLGLFR